MDHRGAGSLDRRSPSPAPLSPGAARVGVYIVLTVLALAAIRVVDRHAMQMTAGIHEGISEGSERNRGDAIIPAE